MVVSYSLKFRVTDLRHGHLMPVKDICFVLGLKKSTAYRVLRTHRLLGTINKSKPGNRTRILTTTDQNALREYLHTSPTLYLDEMQKMLAERHGKSVSISTISRALKQMNYTRKHISGIAMERNEMRRAEYTSRIADLVPDPSMLMFTDESAKDERTQDRRNGWSHTNQRCTSRVHFVRGRRYSILPLLTLDGLITYDIIEGSITSERFLQFLREFVVPLTNPYPGPRSVLVLDNCAIHHSEDVRKLVEDEALCKLVFLPPYSPDYNPIEEAFASIKNNLRRNSSDRTLTAIDRACQAISPQMAFGFFRSSGYV